MPRYPPAREAANRNGRRAGTGRSEIARQRNRFVAAMADEVVFAFISSDGNLSRLAEEITAWRCEPRQLHR
jgi:hypothetical protein